MSVSVTLRQEKTILTDSYRVVSWITAASPVGLFPLFLVKEGVDAYNEEFGGVADLDDLANYVENPLVTLVADVAGEFATAAAGNPITITNAATAAPAWFDTYFTAATFTIAEVDAGGDWIKVESTKPFPTAIGSGLSWNYNSGVLVGTNAACRREDTAEDTFLRRHFTSLLGSVIKAESRVASIKTYVQSIVNASNVHGEVFEGIETDTYT